MALTSCQKDLSVLPVKEYIAIQAHSFIFDVSPLDADVAFEFTLTNFEPQSYTIYTVQTDADNWITGTTEISTVDISSSAPVEKISGSIPRSSGEFSPIAAGSVSTMYRLMLTSKQGNSAVAEPWLNATMRSALSSTVDGGDIPVSEISAGSSAYTLSFAVDSRTAPDNVEVNAQYKNLVDDTFTDLNIGTSYDPSGDQIDIINDIILNNSGIPYTEGSTEIHISVKVSNANGEESTDVVYGAIVAG